MERGIVRKVYRPIFLWIIMFPIMIGTVGFMIYGFWGIIFKLPGFEESNMLRGVEIAIAVCSLIFASFISWLFAGSVKGQKIVLSENEIYAPQNNWIKSDSYQLEVHIPYAEIADILFTVTVKTSENKTVWYMYHPKDWAIFNMKDGNVKRLCIGLYTRKAEIKILDDIIARCAAVGNVLDVSNGKEIIERYSMKKKRKKKVE